MQTREVTVRKIFSAEAVSNTTVYSDVFDLGSFAQSGIFALQVEVSGATITANYELSNNNVDFLTPSTGAAISTDFTPASGPGADGKDIISFQPEPSRFMRIAVTESAADPGVITAWLVMQ
uniref:Uncharacterized protein n=1 Tax=viral metagenome TaxID=1070528 RepID=A0A6M3KIC0_9ZZZZ